MSARAPVIATCRVIKGSPVRTADIHWHARKYARTGDAGPLYPQADATVRAQRNTTNGRAVLDIRAEHGTMPDLVCPASMALLALCDVELDVEQDHIPVRGNASASETAQDKAYEDEILRRLDCGDVWAWCSVRVRVTMGNLTGESSWLGACSYRDRGDFESPGGYYDDLLREALTDLAQKLGIDLESRGNSGSRQVA